MAMYNVKGVSGNYEPTENNYLTLQFLTALWSILASINYLKQRLRDSKVSK